MTENDMSTMTEEINELLEKLKFSEEEAGQIITTNGDKNVQGFESWAVGKIMAAEVPNREAICLFSMLPFEKGKDVESYEFWLVPFWLRIYNIPIELMDRQLALDVGNAIGELVAIGWKERNGGWTEFIRIKVKIDVLKPLRRVVRMVDKVGEEKVGLIKYERLPDFCYACGVIGHTMKTCMNDKDGAGSNASNLQFGSWMRVSVVTSNQERGLRRNGVEMVASGARVSEDKDESQTTPRVERKQYGSAGKEKADEEEELMATYPMERISYKTVRDGMGRLKYKRKRHRGPNSNNMEESPARSVKRKLSENISPSKAVAGDQPCQEP
ncbi:hypothetical protein PVK06_038622 [Gossypium arboreum]|uniref:CCHC-type domain-containing protein n=1 Tax=Gossypium arboreum TaxID=29729 RepID=A0ABR0N0M2_GOSAR|nr:hypothetical protein PVK06_038622 [Gossypium arboreum]